MNENRNIQLSFNDDSKLEKIGDSLSSGYRRRILFLLTKRSYSTQELLEELNISPSTLSFHLKILREAGLIKFVSAPSKKGNEKNFSLNVEFLSIGFYTKSKDVVKTYTIDIPLGSYSKLQIYPPCLIATDQETLEPVDNPQVFDNIEKIKAQLLSFTKGYVEYFIWNSVLINNEIIELTFTQEICSECPNFNNDWKSDISFYINDIKVGTYLSLGDFGGRMGLYSPTWWTINSSNYGVLVNVTINKNGSFINGKKISEININEYLKNTSSIKYKISVDENAKHVGGINIFGKKFGDYKQNISLNITYKTKK